MSTSKDYVTNLTLLTKARGAQVIQHELGNLRTFASQLKHEFPDLDEEETFRDLAHGFLKGIRNEIGKIFGFNETAKLLDPFHALHRSDETRKV